jgi:NAD+ synthase
MYELTKDQCETAITNMSSKLAEYCKLHDIKSVVVGVSGGLDSAVVLALACLARDKYLKDLKVIGVILPCNSTDSSVDLGRQVISKFNGIKIESDIQDVFAILQPKLFNLFNQVPTETLADMLYDDEPVMAVACGNIKARLRMITLYFIANMTHGMVLSTDNLSELWMGFWTLHGDVGDYGMIQQVMKGLELYDIAKCLGIPQEILDARPDDGLGVTDGGDEAQLGANYEDVDRIMLSQLAVQNGELVPTWARNVEPEMGMKVVTRYLNTEFKRTGVVNLTRKEIGLPPLEKIWKRVEE